MSDKPVRVDLEGCRCPGTPHHHDWVELHPDPTIPMGAAVVAAIRRVGDDPVLMQGEFVRIYLIYGIRAWSFEEPREEGGELRPVLVAPQAGGWAEVVEKWLPWEGGGMEVGNAADELYSGRILRPLISRLPKSSPGGPTVGSTSPTRGTGSRHPTPLPRSSRTSTAGRRSGARGSSPSTKRA